MQIAMVGLGKMGNNMALRLKGGGHEVVVNDVNADVVKALVQPGITGAFSLAEVAQKMKGPRAIWIMVPAGKPVDSVIAGLLPHLEKGDILIDGGNSKWTDSIRHSKELAEKGFRFLDCGTSGGVWGLQNGYCIMTGGDESAFKIVEPAIKTLAPPNGYLYTGPAGSGHYSKMVHNGIEYGMMQAYAEGFDVLRTSGYTYDFAKLCDLWMQGSVIRSWLLELAGNAFKADPKLEHIKGFVEDSGEGRWTVQEAFDHSIPAPVLTAALVHRFYSREEESFSAKVVSALRNQFGGHAVKKS